MSKIPTEVQQLLERPLPAIVATTNRDGSPQQSVVWIECQSDRVLFFCRSDSVKATNLKVRPRVNIVVVDPDRTFEPGAPYFVSFTGDATIQPMVDDRFVNGLAQRYMDLPEFPHKGDYVQIVVSVSRVGGIGPSDGSSWGD